MAPVSQPIQSSSSEKTGPSSDEKGDEIDELDREPEVERPRLSLPLQVEEQIGNVDEESSPEMRPPRLSLAMDEGDLTQRSVELPRRAALEGDPGRLSMLSYGGGRLSENIGEVTGLEDVSEGGGDFSGVQGEPEEAKDETVISQGTFEKG